MNFTDKDKARLKKAWIDCNKSFDYGDIGIEPILRLMDIFIKIVPDGQSVNEWLGIKERD